MTSSCSPSSSSSSSVLHLAGQDLGGRFGVPVRALLTLALLAGATAGCKTSRGSLSGRDATTADLSQPQADGAGAETGGPSPEVRPGMDLPPDMNADSARLDGDSLPTDGPLRDGPPGGEETGPEPGTFTIDLGGARDANQRSPLTISNRAVALFALDLSTPLRRISSFAVDTVTTVDTRVPCPAPNESQAALAGLLDQSVGSAAIPRKDTAILSWLDLEMPFDSVPPSEPSQPTSLCLGVRLAGGSWIWTWRPTVASADTVRSEARARIDFEALGINGKVDAVAVLFEKRAYLRTLRFKVRP